MLKPETANPNYIGDNFHCPWILWILATYRIHPLIFIWILSGTSFSPVKWHLPVHHVYCIYAVGVGPAIHGSIWLSAWKLREVPPVVLGNGWTILHRLTHRDIASLWMIHCQVCAADFTLNLCPAQRCRFWIMLWITSFIQLHDVRYAISTNEILFGIHCNFLQRMTNWYSGILALKTMHDWNWS